MDNSLLFYVWKHMGSNIQFEM